MSYASPAFWLLLAATLALTALAPLRARAPVLLAASLLFYAAPDPWRLAWLLGVAAIAGAGLALIARSGAGAARLRLGWGFALGLAALLAAAKFGEGLWPGLPAAPPGYSFYSFTAMALLIDAGRGTGPLPGPVRLLLHLAWFPKLLAGPIERARHLVPQFDAPRLRPGLAAAGFTLILSGLVKKLVIADNLAPVVDAAYAIPAYAAPLDLLIASYFFAFQIYCDFSGYSDLALGLSALVGLRLSENFRRPYLSASVTEFWSARWHITLGHWFRDYVYVPLGGSRRGRVRMLANLMAVFALSGLWHAGLGYGVGWGFLAWGLLNGLYVVGERLLPRWGAGPWRLAGILVTFHLVLVSWVFFRAATLAEALLILRRVAAGLPEMPGLVPRYPFRPEQGWGAAMILALVAVEIAARGRRWPAILAALPLPLRWGAWYAAMGALLLFGRWQGAGFIYAGF